MSARVVLGACTLLAACLCPLAAQAAEAGRAEEPDLKTGLNALQRGEWTTVIAHLEPLRATYPDLVELQHALGLAYYQEQDYARARQLLAGVAAQPGEQQAEALNLLGMCAYAQLDFDAAQRAWRQVLVDHPGGPDAAQAAAGLDVLASDSEVLLHRGMAALRQGDAQRARDLLEPLLSDYPADADLALAVALAAQAQGDHRAALQHGSRALELGSDDPARILALIADSQEALGQTAAAEMTRRRLQTAHPDAPEVQDPDPVTAISAAADAQEEWRPSIFARTGWFWDSNPGLTADTVGLDPGDLDDDQYLQLDLYAEIRQRAGWGLSAFGLFQNYQDLHDNDLGYVQGRADYTIPFEQTRLRIAAQGNRIWIGGEAITQSPSLEAALRWRPNERDTLRLRVVGSWLLYVDERFADQEGLEGRGGIRWRRVLDAQRRWRGEAKLGAKNFAAQTLAESYFQVEPRLGLRWRPPDWEATVELRSRWRWYGDADSGPSEEERRLGIRTGLDWVPNQHVSIGASYEWQVNESNLPDQDWERIEAGLVAAFSWY
ncbi:MAG: tetratricopeptide repeat protein [Planctomycetota bacterium]